MPDSIPGFSVFISFVCVTRELNIIQCEYSSLAGATHVLSNLGCTHARYALDNRLNCSVKCMVCVRDMFPCHHGAANTHNKHRIGWLVTSSSPCRLCVIK